MSKRYSKEELKGMAQQFMKNPESHKAQIVVMSLAQGLLMPPAHVIHQINLLTKG